MMTKPVTLAFLALAIVGFAPLGLGQSLAREDALHYAKSVVLASQVLDLKDNQIHSYVKEVWRADPDAESVPAIGSEYGRPKRYRAGMKHPELDWIIFEFGADRPVRLPRTWGISVDAKGLVPSFLEKVPVSTWESDLTRWEDAPMHVDDVRRLVKKTTPKQTAASRR